MARSLPPLILRAATAAVLLACALDASAGVVAMDDDALRGVHGGDVSIAAHLELNSALLNGATDVDSRIVLGFDNTGGKTYAVLQNLAGIADFYSINIGLRQRSAGDPGSDYFDITLPALIGFTQFGVRALAVTTDPNAAITPANSYGSLILNGSMNMQGHFYMWPK